VILDEPTAALDAKAEHELFARIGELFADRSVLLISHRFSTVRSADRSYVLRDGRIVESGTHDELLAAAGSYAELYTLQASHTSNRCHRASQASGAPPRDRAVLGVVRQCSRSSPLARL
jgi:ATP-binding cassette, subfamily B, bacterial